MDLKLILQFIQIVLALAFVLSLSYGVLRMTKKLTDGNARYMKIIEKVPLGKDAYIAVMQIGETFELVSVTPGNITMVREVPTEDMEKLIQDREAMMSHHALAQVLKKKESLNLTALLQKGKTRKPSE